MELQARRKFFCLAAAFLGSVPPCRAGKHLMRMQQASGDWPQQTSSDVYLKHNITSCNACPIKMSQRNTRAGLQSS
ncbi:hypothetical protein DUNSADRAFT_17951 [Dunaliella salina]|uniref:Encoded protein n=1 Tax=Dunaliella salina TaxID=3046 RepID=A0ABQ7GZJ2_DUNSA|nr:hypothetical protein DUNSADRAFT_17951 [Dunaliella salina]|eukprot:KAF5840034.1 hypothetical protein DUNSADRAFT_17951 [Dunaliella salina]